MSKHKKLPDQLPTIDAREGHTTSTIIVALTGMVNGQYGDIRVGGGPRDYIHVSRLPDGTYRGVHKFTARSFQTNNTLRLAQFIVDQVHLV